MTDNLVDRGRFFRLARYALLSVGPSTVSLVNFAASLLLLKTLSPRDFGLFAFVLVLAQFGFGLSNALVGTPFTIRANRVGYDPDSDGLFFRVNAFVAFAAGLLSGGVAWAMGAGTISLLIAAFSFLAVTRWFLRSYHYALLQPLRASWSDFAYSGILSIALGVALLVGVTLSTAALAFLLAAAAGLVPSLPALGRHFSRAPLAELKNYPDVWREQSRWALLGVVATEATTSAHAWLVSLAAGPAAFAPLAAAGLFFRPLGLVSTSLTQLERPSMARAIMDNKSPARSLGEFRAAMLLAWAALAVIAAGILLWRPSLLIPGGYGMQEVVLAAVLHAAIALLLAWRTPDGTLLQAANQFAPLAGASLVSGGVTLVVSALLLWLFGPVASMLGVLAGQAVLAWKIAQLSRRWSAPHHA